MATTWLSTGGKLSFGVKPPLPILDVGHPLVNGLVFDCNYIAPAGTGNKELTGRTPISTYTASTPTIGPHGAARTFPGSTATDRDTYVTNASVNALKTITVEMLVKFNGAGGGGLGRIFSKGAASPLLDVIYNDANTRFNVRSQWGTTLGEWETTTGTAPLSNWIHFVVAYNANAAANVPIFYVNGVLSAVSVVTQAAGTAPVDTTALVVGNRTAADRSVSADISHVRMWNRMLTASEIAELYSDPFQLYTAPWLYGTRDQAPASIKNAYTLAASVTPFVLAGITTPTTATRNFAASVTTFGLTGNAAPLAHGYNLKSTVTTFALSGIAAPTTAVRKFSAAVTTFALSGKTTGLSHGYKLTPAPGPFVLAGVSAPTTAVRKFSAAVTTFALAGPTTPLTKGLRTSAATGVFALAGIAAGTKYGRAIHANVTTFALNGVAVGLVRARTLTGGTGSFALTGIDVTLSIRQLYTLTAVSTPFTITGFDVRFLGWHSGDGSTKETWTEESGSAGESWSTASEAAKTWTEETGSTTETWTPKGNGSTTWN